MTIALRAQILDSLAKIEGESFVAFCIQQFVKAAHLKSDQDIIEMVHGLQSQAKDNTPMLQRIMGSQFEFINNLEFKQILVCGK